MTYQPFDGNVTNIGEFFTFLVIQNPVIANGFLIIFFLGVAISGILIQTNRSGQSSFFMWFSVSGLLTFILALLFSIANLVSSPVVILTIVVTGLCVAMYLFFDR